MFYASPPLDLAQKALADLARIVGRSKAALDARVAQDAGVVAPPQSSPEDSQPVSEAAERGAVPEPAAAADASFAVPVLGDRAGALLPVSSRLLSPQERRMQAAMDAAVRLATAVPVLGDSDDVGDDEDDGGSLEHRVPVPAQASVSPASAAAAAAPAAAPLSRSVPASAGHKRRRAAVEEEATRLRPEASGGTPPPLRLPSDGGDAEADAAGALPEMLLRVAADSVSGRPPDEGLLFPEHSASISSAAAALRVARTRVSDCVVAARIAESRRRTLEEAHEEAASKLKRARARAESADIESQALSTLRKRLHAAERDEQIISELIERTSEAEARDSRLQKDLRVARMRAVGGNADAVAALGAAQQAVSAWVEAAQQRADDSAELNRRLQAAEEVPASSADALRGAVADAVERVRLATEALAAGAGKMAAAVEAERVTRELVEEHAQVSLQPARATLADAERLAAEAAFALRRLERDETRIVDSLAAARELAIQAIDDTVDRARRAHSALLRSAQDALRPAPTGPALASPLPQLLQLGRAGAGADAAAAGGGASGGGAAAVA